MVTDTSIPTPTNRQPDTYIRKSDTSTKPDNNNNNNNNNTSDNAYTPNQSAVQEQITARLLDDDAADICDVTLHTLDHRAIPACRTLLAIRSPYFNTLFFGAFRESGASLVDVALPSHLLKQVLQFAYSGTSSFVEALCSERDHQKETLLDDAAQLVDLTAAADYCQLSDLHRWCNDVLRKLAKRFRFVVCSALEAMTNHAAIHAFPCRHALLDVLRKNTRECLLVPDCVTVPPPLPGAPEPPGTPYQRLYKRRWDSHGVLKLSADSLHVIVRGILDPQNQEYLFQVVYYWATRGRMLPCTRAPEDDHRADKNPCTDDTITDLGNAVQDLVRIEDRVDVPDAGAVTALAASLRSPIEPDNERWERAKEIVTRLDYRNMRPVFLRDYVRPCGLVDTDVLVDVFCYHATKGETPLEALPDMPDM